MSICDKLEISIQYYATRNANCLKQWTIAIHNQNQNALDVKIYTKKMCYTEINI